MPSRSIIKHFDVLKDILLGFVAGGVVPMIDQLTLERPEETLDAGIVPAVPLAAHAGHGLLLKQPGTSASPTISSRPQA